MNNIGNANIVLPPMTMPPPEPSKGYMAAARYFFNGVEILSKEGHKGVIACALLAAQALECLLKAYLVKKGFDVETLKKEPYGHDLKKLWEEAADNGLGVSRQPPEWCSILNETYNKPYHLRYPIKVNAFAVPDCSKMLDELSKLIEQVERII
jgi:HEPN domain-containing protein